MSPFLEHVATLPCEMFVHKLTSCRTELSKLPCKTQPFKTIAENIQPVKLASFGEVTKIFTLATSKKH